MQLTTRARRALVAATATATLGVSFAGVAFADTLQDSITTSNGSPVTLVAGSSTTGTASIKVIGNSAQGDPDPNCNFDSSTEKLTLDVITPQGVTANPDPLVITSCGTDYPVKFTAAATAASGTATVEITANTTGGTFVNQVSIPITVTHPNTKPSVAVTGVTDGSEYVIGNVPAARCHVTDAEQPNVAEFDATLSGTLVNGLGTLTATCDFTDAGGLKADTATATYKIVPPPNSKPTVAVTGVIDGAKYEIHNIPAAGCAVTDVEDGNSTKLAVITGTLTHGLGTQTATCDYTDHGGLAADTATATYTIVDTGKPTIDHTVSGTVDSNGWYNTDVRVTFDCADEGSGIATCYAEGETGPSKVLGEGADQSVTGTATDWADNQASDTVSGINIDETNPDVALVGGPTGDYYYGSDPAAPTCAASDDLSGVASCVVTGGGSSIGAHTWTATATDNAGNTNTDTISYTVKAWELKGFYVPVDMSGTWNSVKGGSTVPLKFQIFNGTKQLTDTAKVDSFSTKAVACPGSSAPVDAIETVTTGGTSLRYDATGGQFIQNWQTPKKPGTCAVATITAKDGSSITANFMFK